MDSSICSKSVHWFEPMNVPKEYIGGRVGVFVGAVVDNESFEDTIYDIECLGMCKRDIYPLGQVMDDIGRFHYSFIVHPKDTGRFSDARLRHIDLAWAQDELQYCNFSDDFVPFIC